MAHNRCADRHSPASHHRHLLKNSQTYGNKKRRGSKVSLRAYPITQALALPPDKDKQRKACPRQVIYAYITIA